MTDPLGKDGKVFQFLRPAQLQVRGYKVSTVRMTTIAIVDEKNHSWMKLFRGSVDSCAESELVAKPSETYNSEKAKRIDDQDGGIR